MDALTPLQALFCAAVLVAAYAVRGAAGFGSGLIALPLLAQAMPVKLVVPAITLLGLCASLGHGLNDRDAIAWKELLRLMPPTVLGVLAGLYLFAAAPERLLIRALGVFVLGYALLSWLGERVRIAAGPGRRAALLLPVGVSAGLVATLFGGVAGPIYVIYLDSAALDKRAFRVTVATTLLVLAVMRVLGYWGTGVLDGAALTAFAAGLPLMLAGMFIGERIHGRFSAEGFRRFVRLLLAASGAALLLR